MRFRYLSLAVLLTTSPALAQTPTTSSSSDVHIKTIPPGDDVIIKTKKGDVASIEGQLFSNDTALRWANWLEQYRLRWKLDVAYEQKVALLTEETWKKKLELEKDKYNTVTTDLSKRLAAAETKLANPPWYSSPWVGFAFGVVTVGVVVGITAYAVRK